jgi:hypothetical protein
MKDFVWEQKEQSISKALNYANLKSTSFQVWQTVDDQKVILDCSFKKINDERCFFEVVTVKGSSFNFNDEEAIYCKFLDRGLMFKCRIIKQSSSSLHLNFPEEILFQESRNRDRDHFGALSSYYCDLSFSKQSDIKNGYRIFDLCPSGICLLIGKEEKKYFESYKELIMNSIHGVRLSEKTECFIRHIADEESDKFKVGIEFYPKLCVTDYLKIMEAIL